MCTPRFSIIIPVYNTEKYLKRCIDSIIDQIYTNIEIILIDDGSTDSSPSICDEYAQKDNRVVVFHRDNAGEGEARNTGIREAIGDFILFVDSDDYIKADTLSFFVSAIQKHGDIEVITAGFQWVEPNKTHMECLSNTGEVLSGYQFLKTEKRRRLWTWAVWLYCVKRSFIVDNQLFFEKKIAIGVDLLWSHHVLLATQKILPLDFVHYNYIVREDSAMSSMSSKSTLSVVENTFSLIYILEKVYEKVEDKELRAMLMNFLVDMYLGDFLYARSSGEWKECRQHFDKGFLKQKASTFKNKKRVFLYNLHPNVFYYYKTFESKIKSCLKCLSSK